MEAWIILLPAFVLSALMIFTHTYLGLHVLARGVIFELCQIGTPN